MAILDVINIPDLMLCSKDVSVRSATRDLTVCDLKEKWFKQLVFDLFETLYFNAEAVGLAAPQVGEQLKVAVIDTQRDALNPILLINPCYIPIGETKISYTEVCLSFPGYIESVPRFEKILIKTLDIQGKMQEYIVNGYLANVYQHEIDHCNGILCNQRLNSCNDINKFPGCYANLAAKAIEIIDTKGSFKGQTAQGNAYLM